MKKYINDVTIQLIGIFFLINLIQSRESYNNFDSSIGCILFILIHILFIGLLILTTVRGLIKQSFVQIILDTFNTISIPRGAKIATIIIFGGNIIAIIIGKPCYPFYDVGMFRWSKEFGHQDKIVYQPKYYYIKNGEYKILDLRREGSIFFSEHFGWGYTNEFTFAATFHNKAQKNNFEFLSKIMMKRGVDTLWVGIHSVNFETKEVKFDTDICNAIHINKNFEIYYGPIFIPEYQIAMCNEN